MARGIIVSIFADAKQFSHELDKAAGKTRSFQKAAGVAGLALAGGLAYGLEKSVKAAVAAQASTARMDSAFRASGESASKLAGEIGKAEDAGRNLGFTNTDVRDSLGSLEIATHNHRKAISDLAVAENIARFKHTDLASASKMLTMAMSGSQRATKQLGLSLPPVTKAQDKVNASFKKHSGAAYAAAMATAKMSDKQKTAAAVIALVRDKLHGQAKAFSDTAAGGMAKFHAQTDALKENLGNALLPALNAVIGVLSTAAAWLAKHTTIAKILVIGLGILAATLMAVSVATSIAGAVAAIASISFWALALPILAVVAAAALLALAAYEIYKHWGAISGFFGKLWDTVKAAFFTAIDWIKGHWKIFLGLPGLVWQYWGTITKFFGKLWGAITGVFSRAIGWIKGAWSSMISWLVEMLRPLVDAYNLIFGSVTGNIPLAHSGGNSVPKPHGMHGIPGHAKGGIFTKPHLAWIAEKGPEAVIPLRNGVAGGSPLSTGRGGGATVNVGPITVHGTADAGFAKVLAGELATQLRGGRVPAFQQAIAAI